MSTYAMEQHQVRHINIEGKLVAELLDQDEYPSKVGHVVALSDKQICVLRRDWHELTHYRLEYLDINACRAIEYRRETAYYRVIAAAVCFIAAAILLVRLLADWQDFGAENGPLVIALVALIAFGVRAVTSTHRHYVRFEMPEETLIWRSPTIDFDTKAEAALAVQNFARERGILRAHPA